jgi:hypothetical protein
LAVNALLYNLEVKIVELPQILRFNLVFHYNEQIKLSNILRFSIALNAVYAIPDFETIRINFRFNVFLA